MIESIKCLLKVYENPSSVLITFNAFKKYGCPDKFVTIVKTLHDGMQASATMCNTGSKGFQVTKSVKQGCVLAPTLFSIYLAAMLDVTFKDTTERVYIKTRRAGNQPVQCDTIES